MKAKILIRSSKLLISFLNINLCMIFDVLLEDRLFISRAVTDSFVIFSSRFTCSRTCRFVQSA